MKKRFDHSLIILFVFSFFMLSLLISCNPSFTVTFVDENGNIIKKVEVEKNGDAILPALDDYIFQEGYEFSSWEGNYQNVDKDEEVVLKTKKKSFIVSFYYNSDLLKEEKVLYNESASLPDLSSLKLEEGYEVLSWEGNYQNVKQDEKVNLVTSKQSFTVSFYFGDLLLDKQTILYNESATIPNIENLDFLEGYENFKWDGTYQNIKKDENIYLQASKKVFSVSFYFGDILLEEKKIAYNDSCGLPDVTKYNVLDDYANFTWKGNYQNVKQDEKVYLEAEKVIFTLKYYDETGNIFTTEKVNKNESGILTQTPEKEGYKFIKWDKETFDITSDLELYPIFELISYTITYYVDNKIVDLSPSTYDYESLVFTPSYEKEGYEFIGWFESSSSNTKIVSFGPGIAGNKVFYARFEKVEDNKITLPEGAFYFTNIKLVPHAQNPNLLIPQPDFTGINNCPSNRVLDYTWATSDNSVATVSSYSSLTAVGSGYCILSATYKKDTSIVGYAILKVLSGTFSIVTEEEANKVVTYLVTFEDINGNVISTQEVKEGGEAVLPLVPVIEGKYFTGWDKPYYNIVVDTFIRPTYKDGSLDYYQKNVAILGDSISTYKGYMISEYPNFYPYATADIKSVHDTWWMQLIDKMGMNLLVNNSCSGSCVSSGTGSNAAVNDNRLNKLIKNGQKPDIIIIFMGANDCGSKYVNSDTFDASYNTMLEKITKLCPDSEIFIMTLPPTSGFYSEEDRVIYNDIIVKYVRKYDATLIEMSNIYTSVESKNYVCDAVHPNKKGMDKFFETVYNVFINQ